MRGLSIIIVNRNEPMCGFTVRRCFETADCPIEVIVVDDGSEKRPIFGLDMLDALVGPGKAFHLVDRPKPVGLAFCRDIGIERARYDACLVLDAHTNFLDSNGWASYCRDHALNHPEHFGCCVSVQLDSDPWNSAERQMAMDVRYEPDGTHRPRASYYGATIQLIGKNGRPFPSKWNGDYAKLLDSGGWGVIQSALGGHYVLNRTWYMETLRRPWRENRAWGTSEQTITIANWLLGGESVLLPVRMGHQYRSGKQARVPYKYDERMAIGQVWNQWKLCAMLPLPGDLSQRMCDILTTLNDRPIMLKALDHDHGQVQGYRRYLSEQKRTMQEYFERWDVDTYLPSVQEVVAGWEPGSHEGE